MASRGGGWLAMPRSVPHAMWNVADEYGLAILDDWSDELKAKSGITL
jgi:hypothetical protein